MLNQREEKEDSDFSIENNIQSAESQESENNQSKKNMIQFWLGIVKTITYLI